MTFQKAFVLQKLDEANGYLKEMEDFFKSSDTEILADSGKLHIAERLLQLLVDTILDINQHFIKELGLKLADDLQSTFITVGECGVLPKEFAERIAPVTGVRNILVHQYEKLDKETFLRNLRHHFSDF